MRLQHRQRPLGHLPGAVPAAGLAAGDHHVGLQDHALQRHALLEQLLENGLQHQAGDLLAPFDAVLAVHQHLRLDHRHDLVRLAQGGVAGQGVGVGLDRGPGRDTGGDVDHRPPFGEARAPLVVAGEPLAEPVQALGDCLARKPGQGLGAIVDLDPRNGAGVGDQLDQGRAVGGVLPYGLVEQDPPADVIAHRLGGAEQQLAIVAAVLLGGLHPDGVEALLDGSRRFVGGQDPLARGQHPASHIVQRVQVHLPPLEDISPREPRPPAASCLPSILERPRRLSRRR